MDFAVDLSPWRFLSDLIIVHPLSPTRISLIPGWVSSHILRLYKLITTQLIWKDFFQKQTYCMWHAWDGINFAVDLEPCRFIKDLIILHPGLLFTKMDEFNPDMGK